MRDADIRAAVRRMLDDEHAEDAHTRIVEEMGIWSGSVRIDLAVINGQLTGYELKSDRDTLDRLPAQAEFYSRVFDEVYLVVGSRHVSKARRIVPRWWGVIVAKNSKGTVLLERVRECKPNPSPDAMLVARFLWRSEALAALEAAGLVKGFRTKSAPELHRRLVSCLSYPELSRVVREALKSREAWLGKPVGNKRQMPIYTNLDPSLAAPWGAGPRNDLTDAAVTPAAGQPAESGFCN